MKTDMQLQRDVIEELAWQPNIREAEIAVGARNGVVTLSGFVDSYAQKYAAARAVESVRGVRAVADDLKVRLPQAFVRSDTDVAHAAVSALKWDVEVPDTRIKVLVDDGWISLDGAVDWQFQRTAAENAVRHLAGVNGVINRITVQQPKVSAYEVNQRIEEALKRNAALDAEKISIDARDGRVVLRGTVRSWAEREDAERAAWAAPGVTEVDDELAVAF
ncbi:MAG: BON domain-containing protein [Gemmatimonadota bacterium]|nr:BON domain-containing protein [Gemmatimonadota bacterium]MDE3172979.1 BON domain-containing protein [Gemmatimonadota bacterium]